MGHGYPFHSTSGRLTVTAMIHAFGNVSAGTQLTTDDAQNPSTVSKLADFVRSVAHMGPRDTARLAKMVERGSTYLHA